MYFSQWRFYIRSLKKYVVFTLHDGHSERHYCAFAVDHPTQKLNQRLAKRSLSAQGPLSMWSLPPTLGQEPPLLGTSTGGSDHWQRYGAVFFKKRVPRQCDFYRILVSHRSTAGKLSRQPTYSDCDGRSCETKQQSGSIAYVLFWFPDSFRGLHLSCHCRTVGPDSHSRFCAIVPSFKGILMIIPGIAIILSWDNFDAMASYRPVPRPHQ